MVLARSKRRSQSNRPRQESAWREGHRRASNGDQAKGVVALALKARPRVDFCGYWQR